MHPCVKGPVGQANTFYYEVREVAKMCHRRFKQSDECTGNHVEGEKKDDAQEEHITNLNDLSLSSQKQYKVKEIIKV